MAVLVGVGLTRVGTAVGVEIGARVGAGDCVFAAPHAHRLQDIQLTNTMVENDLSVFIIRKMLVFIACASINYGWFSR